MHPLLISHLIADFLLQPTILVKWKQKEISGIIMHSAVHSLVMLLLLFPAPPAAVALILVIAILHGLIDHLKIRYQKIHAKDFARGFATDQLAHLIIIFGAISIFPVSYPHWHSEAFQGSLALLTFFSFAFGIFHLSHPKIPQPAKITHRAGRLLLLTAVFIIFTVSSKLFVASCR